MLLQQNVQLREEECRVVGQNLGKFPVIFPVSRELGAQQKVLSPAQTVRDMPVAGNLAAVCTVCYHDIIGLKESSWLSSLCATWKTR